MKGDSVLHSLIEDLLCARPGTAESGPEWRGSFFGLTYSDFNLSIYKVIVNMNNSN